MSLVSVLKRIDLNAIGDQPIPFILSLASLDKSLATILGVQRLNEKMRVLAFFSQNVEYIDAVAPCAWRSNVMCHLFRIWK